MRRREFEKEVVSIQCRPVYFCMNVVFFCLNRPSRISIYLSSSPVALLSSNACRAYLYKQRRPFAHLSILLSVSLSLIQRRVLNHDGASRVAIYWPVWISVHHCVPLCYHARPGASNLSIHVIISIFFCPCVTCVCVSLSDCFSSLKGTSFSASLSRPIALWDKTRSFWDVKNSLSHERGSERSERANEWAQRRAWAKPAVWSKQTSERCEQTSERTNEWPSTYIWVFGYSGPQCHIST